MSVYFLFLLSLSFLFIIKNSGRREPLKDFKKDCNDIFKNSTNLSLEKILEKLNKLINKYKPLPKAGGGA